MERMVAHPLWRHCRPALYAFDGRSFPAIGWPATDPSDISSPTCYGDPLFRGLLDFSQGGGDPQHQRLRDVVPALLAHDDPQLGLEVVGLEARRAVVEVMLDQDPSIIGELPV